MNRIDYCRAVLLGAVVATFFLSMFYVFTTDDKPVDSAPVSKFKVVDTYKGCDVVQWHYGMLAEYKYFLVCKDK